MCQNQVESNEYVHMRVRAYIPGSTYRPKTFPKCLIHSYIMEHLENVENMCYVRRVYVKVCKWGISKVDNKGISKSGRF